MAEEYYTIFCMSVQEILAVLLARPLPYNGRRETAGRETRLGAIP